MSNTLQVDHVRGLFPALQRKVNGQLVAFFDGPAGSQVPRAVADAVANYLLTTNSNRGAVHATAVESDAVLENAHQIFADFLGTPDPTTVFFGANMTTLTLGASRAIAKEWKAGDEIIVSRLDHDANVTPWMLAAQDAGATVHHINLNPYDWTLDLEDFHAKLSSKTKLVAVGYASNATGTVNPVKAMIDAARSAGALTYIDAVHFAPHGRIDVTDLNCDFLACSAYKFFGPHVGVLYGRRELLERIRPYKLRPSTDDLPGRWMTGTQNHEGIVGAAGAVEYLASLARDGTGDRHEQLTCTFEQIGEYERGLSRRFLEGITSVAGCMIYGIADPGRLHERVPTFSMTFRTKSPREVALILAQQGIFAWAGNHYALPFTEVASLEPGGTLRIGALHYNTVDEIDRVIQALHRAVA